MEKIIQRIASKLDYIDLRHPGESQSELPYVNYEYNSVTFYNQNQIIFTMDVTAASAAEAESFATRIRKTLHEYLHEEAEVSFKVTDTPAVATVISNELGFHVRRLNFTIIAYFEELELFKYVTVDDFVYVTDDNYIYVWR